MPDDIKERFKRARDRLEKRHQKDGSVEFLAREEQTIEQVAKQASLLSFQDQEVSVVFKGHKFNVAPHSDPQDAMRAYITQGKFLDNMSLKELYDILGSDVKNDDSYISSVKAEITKKIVSDYPEEISKISTLHLMNAVYNSPNMASGNKALIEALNNSAKEYMSGKQTFKPTVMNVMYLDQLEDYLYKSGQYRLEDLETRRKGVEQDMLSSVKMAGLTGAELVFVGKVAQKYPSDKNAQRALMESSIALQNQSSRKY